MDRGGTSGSLESGRGVFEIRGVFVSERGEVVEPFVIVDWLS